LPPFRLEGIAQIASYKTSIPYWRELAGVVAVIKLSKVLVHMSLSPSHRSSQAPRLHKSPHALYWALHASASRGLRVYVPAAHWQAHHSGLVGRVDRLMLLSGCPRSILPFLACSPRVTRSGSLNNYYISSIARCSLRPSADLARIPNIRSFLFIVEKPRTFNFLASVFRSSFFISSSSSWV